MSIQNAFRGVTCPLVTPFNNGSINKDALKQLLDHVQEGGIKAVFPCGTTGEFPSMSSTEQQHLIKTVSENADVPVIAGAAETSIEDTVNKIDTAASLGADAAAIVPPYFISANNPKGNQQVFESVLDQSPIPVLLYNIPQCTGQRIEPETVSAIAAHNRALGIKDSSGDMEYFSTVLRDTPDDFLCLQGYDALLVPSLRIGGDGGINALSNVIPGIFRETFDHANETQGQRLQEEAIMPLFEMCTKYGFAPATKSALVYRGILPSNEVRPPLVPVTDKSIIRAPLKNALDAIK